MELPYRKAFAEEAPGPNEHLIEDALGASYPAWLTLLSSLEGEFGLTPQWIYYRDGGWLCKTLKGKKNLAWLSVWEGLTTVTFYFAHRHREELVSLDLPEDLISKAATNEMVGKMLPFLLEVRTKDDVESVRTVMRMKLRASGNLTAF